MTIVTVAEPGASGLEPAMSAHRSNGLDEHIHHATADHARVLRGVDSEIDLYHARATFTNGLHGLGPHVCLAASTADGTENLSIREDQHLCAYFAWRGTSRPHDRGQCNGLSGGTPPRHLLEQLFHLRHPPEIAFTATGNRAPGRGGLARPLYHSWGRSSRAHRQSHEGAGAKRGCRGRTPGQPLGRGAGGGRTIERRSALPGGWRRIGGVALGTVPVAVSPVELLTRPVVVWLGVQRGCPSVF